MRFASPWALLALLILVPLAYRRIRSRGDNALRFSSLDAVSAAGTSWRQRLLWLPAGLEFLALTCLAIAWAQPQFGMKHVKNLNKGIAIEMLLDISSSMDLSIWSQKKGGSRLKTAKEVFERFVTGDEHGLTGRPHDLIGMVTFARYADTVCPLTLGHDALLHFLHAVTIEDRPGEDGTAIGDALALGAARLKTAEEAVRKQAENIDNNYEIQSKVIILLTDGESNSGQHLPEEGAALARKWGIRLYVIGFGDQQEIKTVETPNGPRRIAVALGADAKTLVKAAESTGGLFRMAHDADSLQAVYLEIDQLEKSKIETLTYLEYRDWFGPFAFGAATALFLEMLLRSTWLRRIP